MIICIPVSLAKYLRLSGFHHPQRREETEIITHSVRGLKLVHILKDQFRDGYTPSVTLSNDR